MNLSQEEWASRLSSDDNAVVLDVRTQDEVDEGVIPNATNIDIYKGAGFINAVDELDKTKNYYVYCKAGSRSEQACKIMNQLGFENTFNLKGGISDWRGEVVVPE